MKDTTKTTVSAQDLFKVADRSQKIESNRDVKGHKPEDRIDMICGECDE
jgi:hypothetical protein